MKRNLEDLLREAPLRAPSEQLAGRIDDALRDAEAKGTRWFTAPIPLWGCVAAAIVCAGLGYLARGTPAPPPVVYVLPAEGELRRVLNGDAARPAENFYRGLQVRVTKRDGKKL